jgi:3'-5' exoribonuclease
MAKRFVNQLVERENVDEVFLVIEKQLRANRSGNLYLQLRLADRTGSLTAMMWNANDRVSQSFESGDYVRVQGASQFYNGQMQLILTKVNSVDPATIHESDFVVLGPAEVEQLLSNMSDRLRQVEDVHLRSLAEAFLVDEILVERFLKAPAGIKNHHAYQGGLLQHVVSLMGVADRVADQYPRLNRDLLLLGVLFHDLGKVEELSYDKDMSYTTAGQLLGHVVQGVELLEKKLRQAEELSGEPFPDSLSNHLKHLILSHHGEYEYGSPKLPMTPEAMALHLIDNLDAKLHQFFQLIDEDANAESPWTTYQPSLGRKILKTSI